MRRRRLRSSRFRAASVTRTLQTYFDWHPLLGGLAVMVASAFSVALLSRLLGAVIPKTEGWPLCTPLNGVVLAVLLMSRRKLWPFVLFGYILALSRGMSLVGVASHPGALQVACNIAELLIAALTLPPYRNFKQWLQEPRLMSAFAGYALFLGPAVMALAAARSSAGSFGAVAGAPAGYWERVRIVGFSESLGLALGAPLMLVLCNGRTYRLLRWRALPITLGLFALLSISTWFGFTRTADLTSFLPYAVLVLIAFELGIRGAVLGAATASAIICARAASFTLNTTSSISPQSFLALAVLVALPLGVTLFNRAELERRVVDYKAELDKLKSLDRITGVANRKRFDLVLTREWQRATRDPKPIALLMIDTDFFEIYNVQYGTHAGDECLRLIASKMADKPHRQYDLLSRFEGGRFSLLLPGASGEAVKRIGEEFRAEIAALEWPHQGSQFGRVTVSVGWASMLPDSESKPEQLIAAAEAALESAKRKGKNRVEGFAGDMVELTSVR